MKNKIETTNLLTNLIDRYYDIKCQNCGNIFNEKIDTNYEEQFFTCPDCDNDITVVFTYGDNNELLKVEYL
jgi:ribosomal protein S27E